MYTVTGTTKDGRRHTLWVGPPATPLAAARKALAKAAERYSATHGDVRLERWGKPV